MIIIGSGIHAGAICKIWYSAFLVKMVRLLDLPMRMTSVRGSLLPE
jgi:hypothetical protein